MSSALVAAVGLYESRDIKRVDEAGSVWDIREPWFFALSRRRRSEKVAQCRSELWSALLHGAGSAFLWTSESPVEYEVPGPWQALGKHSWQLPADFDPAEPATTYWLSHGGWLAYRAAAACTDWPDLFGMTPEQATRWASDNGVTVALQSFHDDMEWRVVIKFGERADEGNDLAARHRSSRRA